MLDLHRRKIVGWAMSPTIDSALVLSALAMATRHRTPPPGLLFHSDRGVPSAAGNFRAALQAAGLLAAMSRRGNCHDNAARESCWSTRKLELGYRRQCDTRLQAQTEIFDFIEAFDNRRRRHTSLAGLSPPNFELLNYQPTNPFSLSVLSKQAQSR